MNWVRLMFVISISRVLEVFKWFKIIFGWDSDVISML